MKRVLELFRRYDLKKGIFFVLLAWLSFSLMYTVSKLIGDQTSIPTMLFFRSFIPFIIVLPWIFKNRPKSFEFKNWKLVVFRALMGLFNILFIFLAIEKISLVNTTLLNNTAPFFIPFVLWFWMRTHIDFKLWPAILIGFIGVVLILQPETQLFNLGAAYALLSGICLAIALVTMGQTSRQESFYTFMFYFFGIGLIATTPFAIATWRIENGLALLGLISIGLFSAAGLFCLYYGLKFGKSYQLAPFAYTTVFFTGIFEWLFWGVLPQPLAYLGMILLIGAGIWIILVGRQTKHLS